MLRFLDVLLTVVHLAIVAFNLLGWIPRSTRRAHFISILVTAACWFLLGIWYGMGFCPVTEWHWNVKAKLGEQNIPNNFIEYIAEKVFGYDFDPQLVGTVIAVCFGLAAMLSVWVNFVVPGLKRRVRRRLGA
jgi:hypothetical protein